MLVGDLIINATKAIGHGATFLRGTYGVVVSRGRIVTDKRDGKHVNFWDVLQFGLNSFTAGFAGNGLIKSTGASVGNVKGLNELRVSKSTVGGNEPLLKTDLQFFAGGKNSKGGSQATKDLYRAVGPEEFDDIFATNSFRQNPNGNSYRSQTVWRISMKLNLVINQLWKD